MDEPTKTELAFLAMLARGVEFTKAATSLAGDDVLRVPFSCTLNGWVNQGAITQKGRELVAKALKPVPWEITVPPPAKRSRTDGG